MYEEGHTHSQHITKRNYNTSHMFKVQGQRSWYTNKATGCKTDKLWFDSQQDNTFFSQNNPDRL